MAKLWKPVLRYERGRQILLFLFCLFLAFIIWTLHRLSENQTVYLQYRLHLTTNIAGRETDAISDVPLVIKGEANGFYVLRNLYSQNSPVVTLDVNHKFLKKCDRDEDMFLLKSSDIQDKVADFLANNVSNLTISTDTLFFNFPKRSTRRVPVAPVINNSVRIDKNSLEVSIIPEFVTITGSGNQTGNADTIYTENIDFSGIASQKSGVIKLQSKPGIKYSVKEVYYSLKPVKSK